MHSIGLYTIDNCSYCEQAKSLLDDKGLEYKTYKIETADERSQLKKKYPEASSFPVVIINHKWLGGFTQLMDWIRNEKL